MSSHKVLGDYVAIAPRFRRSVHLVADFGDPKSLKGYVVSPLVRDSTLRIATALAANDGHRAWTLVGPYGTGKSSFATLFAHLLGDSSQATLAHKLFRAHWPTQHNRLKKALQSVGPPLLPVLLTGERVSAPLALARALRDAADSHWTGRSRPPAILKRLRALCDKPAQRSAPSLAEEVLDLTEALVSAIHGHTSPRGGLCIIIDEMGKLLEHAVHHPSDEDVFFFQQLAELTSRVGTGRLCLIGVLHQEITQYSQGLPKAIRSEWEKVAGRYQPHPFLESPQHLLELTAGAISAAKSVRQLPLWKDSTRTSKKLAKQLEHWADPAELTNQLQACLPLHPVTALALGPLFRQRLGQNERSMFAFLTSRDVQGFQVFLENTDRAEKSSYQLDQLYDYLIAGLGIHTLMSTGDRIWAATEEALARLPAEAEPLDAAVVKATTILSLTSTTLPLRASAETLALALNEPLPTTKKSIARLTKASILLYRDFKQSYQIWDGSDLDISVLVSTGRKAVQALGKLAEQLQRHFPPEPVVAGRHYYQTGTLRFLRARFVGSGGLPPGVPEEGDGDLLYVIPDSPTTKPPSLHSKPLFNEDRLHAWMYPKEQKRLHEAILDYLGTVESLESTGQLADDPVARRALQERKVESRRALELALARSFRAPESAWHVGKDTIEVGRHLSRPASELFDKAYPKAPTVLNELINRRELSSQAAKAQRVLLERMITHESSDRLGIEGHPPELSMYRSLLESTKLHRKKSGTWQFCAPGKTENTHTLWWDSVNKLLSSSDGSRRSAAQIITHLEGRPLGIRPAVSAVLLLTYYLANRDSLFLYDEGTFVPEIGHEFSFRLLKNPDRIEFQKVEMTGVTGKVVKALAKELNAPSNSLLDVVKHLIGVALRLSPYAMQTRTVSETAMRIRGAVRSARDPHRLLLKDLRTALGHDDLTTATRCSPADLKAFAEKVRQALDELLKADTELDASLESAIRQLLGAAPDQEDFFKELVGRAEALSDSEALSEKAKRFVDLTLAVDPREDPAEWRRAIGQSIIGKPNSTWDDTDYGRFLHQAMPTMGAFIGAERLTLELNQRKQGSAKLIRVSVLDSEGREKTGLAVVRPSQLAAMTKLKRGIQRLAKDAGCTSREAAYLAISEILSLAEQAEEESSQEGAA